MTKPVIKKLCLTLLLAALISAPFLSLAGSARAADAAVPDKTQVTWGETLWGWGHTVLGAAAIVPVIGPTLNVAYGINRFLNPVTAYQYWTGDGGWLSGANLTRTTSDDFDARVAEANRLNAYKNQENARMKNRIDELMKIPGMTIEKATAQAQAEANKAVDAASGGKGPSIMEIIGNIMAVVFMYIVQAFSVIVAQLVSVMLNIIRYPINLNMPAVNSGWAIIRDVCNNFFIIIMLVIAVGTVLRRPQYMYKDNLPKLLVAAVLINFSKMIIGIGVDFSQILMMTFAAPLVTITGNNLILAAIGLPDLQQFVDKISSAGVINYTSTIGVWNIVIVEIWALVVSFVAAVVILCICGVLIWRIITIIFLAVLAPLPFFFSSFKKMESYAGEYWQMFTKMMVVGPAMLFFLWLSFTIMGFTGSNDQPSGAIGALSGSPRNLSNTPGAISQSLGDINSAQGVLLSKAMSVEGIINYLLVIGLLVMSLQMGQKFGGYGSKIAGSGQAFLQKQSKRATNFAKGTGKFTAGLVAEKTGLTMVRDVAKGYVKKYTADKAKARGERVDKWVKRVGTGVGAVKRASMAPLTAPARWIKSKTSDRGWLSGKNSRLAKEKELIEAQNKKKAAEETLNRTQADIETNSSERAKVQHELDSLGNAPTAPKLDKMGDFTRMASNVKKGNDFNEGDYQYIFNADDKKYTVKKGKKTVGVYDQDKVANDFWRVKDDENRRAKTSYENDNRKFSSTQGKVSTIENTINSLSGDLAKAQKEKSDAEADELAIKGKIEALKNREAKFNMGVKLGLAGVGVIGGAATGGLGAAILGGLVAGVGVPSVAKRINEAGETDRKMVANYDHDKTKEEQGKLKDSSDSDIRSGMNDPSKTAHERMALALEAMSRKMLSLDEVKKERDRIIAMTKVAGKNNKKIEGALNAVIERKYPGASKTFNDYGKDTEAGKKAKFDIRDMISDGSLKMDDLDDGTLRKTLSEFVDVLKSSDFMDKYKKMSYSQKNLVQDELRARVASGQAEYKEKANLTLIQNIKAGFGNDTAGADKFIGKMTVKDLQGMIDDPAKIDALREVVSKDINKFSAPVRAALEKGNGHMGTIAKLLEVNSTKQQNNRSRQNVDDDDYDDDET